MSSRKKQLPPKINILGKDIRVLKEKIKKEEGEAKIFGEFNDSKMLIKINPKLTPHEEKITLFHEAVHAALHVSGLTHLLPSDGKLEEALVRVMEHAFAHAIDIHKLAK